MIPATRAVPSADAPVDKVFEGKLPRLLAIAAMGLGAALGALLYTVVTSDTVEQALSGIFDRALNTK